MKTRLLTIVALMISPAIGVCSDIHINALGCVVSLPNVSDVTASPPSNVSFLFGESKSGPLELAIVAEYPGDAVWNEKNTEHTSRIHEQFHGLDLVVITVRRKIGADMVYRGLTDKKIVVYFKNTDSDLSRYVTCKAQHSP